MQKRNVLNSSRLLELKRHRKKVVINKFIFFLLGLCVLFVLAVYISHLSALNINNIEISGNQVVDTDAIKTVIEQQISGKYFLLFPKTNVFFYPKNSIVESLQNNFKIFKDINISIKNTKTLEVSLTERKALYTWCGLVPPTSGPNNCYFVDQDGYIFDEAPYFSGEVYFKFYGTPDGNLKSSDPSGLYFSQPYFQQLVSFRDMLVSLGLNPVSLYVTDDGDVQVFLSSGNTTSSGPEILLKLNADYENVAENLEAALTTEPLQSEFKNKYSTLQYIDLRFGNKVYFK